MLSSSGAGGLATVHRRQPGCPVARLISYYIIVCHIVVCDVILYYHIMVCYG